MADENTQVTEPETEQTEETGPKGLREAKDRETERANVYHAKAMALAFENVGIDVTQGVGKLLLGAYDGEPDVTEVEAFAVDNGWTKPGVPTPTETSESVARTDSRLATATAHSTSEVRNEHQERLDEAAKSGQWKTFIRLQQESYAAIARRKFEF